MTPDLQRLQQTDSLGPIIEQLELELVDDPGWAEPSDTSYLNDQDRANPDIMSNVEAMAATNRLIAWFGRDQEGFVGLWRGPGERALGDAPVVRLDSEGQYSIVAASIPEYIAISVPEDEFAGVRDALLGAGFAVGNNPDAIWGALDAFADDPNAYRNELYEQNRIARGLARSDAIGDEDAEADDLDAVPEPVDDAPLATAPVEEDAIVGEVDADEDEEPGEDEDDDDEAPPAKRPAAKPPAKQPAARKPAAKAAAKKPAAKKPAAKPAAKKAAKKPVKKPAAKKPAAKKPVKKLARKK